MVHAVAPSRSEPGCPNLRLYLRGMPLDVCSYVLPGKVTYTGASVVHEGQPWMIMCSGLKSDDVIRWTRNGQSLEPQLSSGELSVNTTMAAGISTLRAMHATDTHNGDYKCTDSSDVFPLWIYFGSYALYPSFTYDYSTAPLICLLLCMPGDALCVPCITVFLYVDAGRRICRSCSLAR